MRLAVLLLSLALTQQLGSAPGLAGPPLLAGAAALTITPVDEKGELWQEPYVDANENGRYDAPDPLRPDKHVDPFTDLNGNGKWDGPFLAGFKHTEKYYTATGVHDHLWARALVLQTGDTKVALVALDLVGLLHPEVQRIRKEVSDLGLDYVLIASTHTHAGTDSIGLWGPNPFVDGKDPRFMEHIRRQAAKAIRRAHASLQPARLTAVETRFPTEFGSIIRDRRDPIVIDDRLVALRVATPDGETIAVLVNGAPHPETLGGENSLISSDFPHFLREGLEKGGYVVKGETIPPLGGVALYFSGALGGLLTTLRTHVKDEAGQVLPQRSFEKTRRIGELAAWAVTRALQGSAPEEVKAIQVRSRRLSLPADNRYLDFMLQIGVIEREATPEGSVTAQRGQEIETEVAVLRIDGEKKPVAEFVTYPGEPFPELVIGGHLTEVDECWRITERKKAMDGVGRERVGPANPHAPPETPLKDHFKSDVRFVLGLANDELGYIVPRNDFVFPRYTPAPVWGTDRCGDDRHYEETLSASSRMAPIVNDALIEMLSE